ncbi:hypothetical protein [Rhizobium mongolense]
MKVQENIPAGVIISTAAISSSVRGIPLSQATLSPDEKVRRFRRIADPLDRAIRIKVVIAPTSGLKPGWNISHLPRSSYRSPSNLSLDYGCMAALGYFEKEDRT